MKLEHVALGVVVVFGVLWLVTFVTGLLVAVPFGIVGLVPVAVIGGLLVAVIVQRLNNCEDDYYDKNVDQ